MDNSQFQERLIPTAYGIHDKINRSLQNLFETELGHSCFSFYEYVLETPLTVFDDYKTDNQLSHQRVAAPYLRRFAHQYGIMPAVSSAEPLKSLAPATTQVEMVPYTPTNIQEYWKDYDCAMLDLNRENILTSLLQYWISGQEQFHFACPPKKPVEFQKVDDVAAITCFFKAASLSGLPKLYADAFKRELTGISKMKSAKKKGTAVTELSELTALQLREYALAVMPFLQKTPDKDVCICAFSLSSGSVFWGHCFVIFPIDKSAGQFKTDTPKELQVFISNLQKLVYEEIREVYVPVLTLLKNTVEESKLKNLLDTIFTDKGAKEKGDRDKREEAQKHLKALCCPVANSKSELQSLGAGKWPSGNKALSKKKLSAKFISECLFGRLVAEAVTRTPAELRCLGNIEKRLVELWADRFWRLGYVKERQNVLDSLLFEKYLVASPKLMSRVTEAINLHHRRSGKKSVTSALVVGGPGSGKDTMAKLIWLFSPGFRFGGLRTFNMATFRPKEAAVPLLLGLDVRDRQSASSIQVQLRGVLLRALCTKMKQPVTTEETRRGFSFIFDELNSLDIDTQGALLRFLENAELTPLGGLSNPLDVETDKEPKPVSREILVIGVMNEDPHMIMKRHEMDRILKQGELFGTILGQTLHEMFRNQRRLRDDLYYRLIRGGEIVLPSLSDRTEDIPSIFYHNITQSKTMFPEDVNTFEVDLSVYDVLMSHDLKWEGNLRELQTLSRNILLEAKAAYERDPNTEKRLIIRGIHARLAVKRLHDSRAHNASIS